MNNTVSWIAKSLLISAVIALVTGAAFYLFFRVHEELNIPPSYAWKLGAIVFILSAVFTMIYFRMRAER